MMGHHKWSTLQTAAAGAAAFVSASAAHAQGITDGSFESGASAWQTTGGAYVGTTYSNLATDGSQVGFMSVGGGFGDASGSVYQEFTLSQAGRFSYGFDAGTVFFGGFSFPATFAFKIDDTLITDALPVFVSDSVAFSYYPLQTRIEGALDLTAGTHRFGFELYRPGTLFARSAVFVVDDITTGFSPLAAGVPEPSAWALLILGFGAVGAGMRTRRRPVAAFA